MALFLITGASGSGKTSLSHKIQDDGYWKECISFTTRPIREADGEKDGVTYNFITREYFENNVDEFAEHVEYFGNYYGLSKEEIDSKLRDNKHAFAIVEYNGYQQLKKLYPDSIGLFLYADKEDCKSNMLSRGDSIENVNNRLSTYEDEISSKGEYDYVVKNVYGKADETIDVIKSIINQNN